MTQQTHPPLVGNNIRNSNGNNHHNYKNYIIGALLGAVIVIGMLSGYAFYLNQNPSKAEIKPEAISNSPLNQDTNGVQSREKESQKLIDPNVKLEQTTPTSDGLTKKNDPAQTDTQTQINLTEYKQYAAKLKKIVVEQDPKIALLSLVKDTSSTKVVQEQCHSLTHVIGNEALAKYNNNIQKSMEYYVDTCGGGYLHGIIEKYLKISPNPEADIFSLCPRFSDGICVHGIGHGLMLMNNYDIPKSVVGCQKLPSGAQVACAEGVFMENYDAENADDADKSFLNPGDPAVLCTQYSGGYKSACYYYLGRYLLKITKDPYQALQKCTQSGDNTDITTCIRGMGAGIVRADLYHPEKMEDYCNSVPFAKSSCIQGAVNYHLLMISSETETRTSMCANFVNQANKNLCNSLIDSSPFK